MLACRSLTGKSRLLLEFLKYRNQLFTTEYDAIFYCFHADNFAANQEYLDELRKICPKIKIVEGLPPISFFQNSRLPKLFLFDDLMTEIFATADVENLFTRRSHHYSNDIIFTSQNYFNSKKDLTIVRNLPYKIVFNKRCERRYMLEIGSQLSSDTKYFSQCFELLAQQNPAIPINNKFLLIDSHPESPMGKYPIRGLILPDKDGKIRPLMFPNEI